MAMALVRISSSDPITIPTARAEARKLAEQNRFRLGKLVRLRGVVADDSQDDETDIDAPESAGQDFVRVDSFGRLRKRARATCQIR